MSIEVRPCNSVDELRAALTPIWHYFGRPPADEQVANFARVLTPQRAHAAWEDGQVVGGCGSYGLDLTVPGGRVRAAGGPPGGAPPRLALR